MLFTSVSLRDRNVFFIRNINQGATKKNAVKTVPILLFFEMLFYLVYILYQL